MADLLVDFQQYFINNEITDVIFLDSMLADPDTAYGFYEYSGQTPRPQIAGAERNIQIVSRHPIPVTAKGMCSKLYHLLETETGSLYLTPERWCQISLKQPPFKLRVDEQNRAYYCFNVAVITYID